MCKIWSRFGLDLVSVLIAIVTVLHRRWMKRLRIQKVLGLLRTHVAGKHEGTVLTPNRKEHP